MEKKLRHCSTFIIADTDAVDLVAEVLPLDLRVSHHLKVNEVQSFCHHFFNFCNHHLTCNVFVIIFSISVITTLRAMFLSSFSQFSLITTLSWTCSYCLAKLFKNLYCSSKVRYLGMISNKSVFLCFTKAWID